MQQMIVFVTLILAMAMFVWGKIRYDLVALCALFILAIFGVVSPREAFSGFSHAAVITVVAVMIISRAMLASGVIDAIARHLKKLGGNILLQVLTLSAITAVASAFMNNVGALAIMMPIAIQLARKNKYPPSFILMPLAFSSLLGGMTTMIGTPPNIIIATLRQDVAGESFKMFDFTPVGLGIVITGVLFVSLAGRLLLPARKAQRDLSDFEIDDYVTEVRVAEDSKILEMTIGEIQENEDYEVNILGLIRNKMRLHAPGRDEKLREGDIVILEADSENLESFLDVSGAKLLGDKKFRRDAEGSQEISIREVVVAQDSFLVGKSAASIRMRTRYGINLLALSRGGGKTIKRLDHIKFRVGDVLLLQGRTERLAETISRMGCLPVAERDLRIGSPKRIISTLLIFGAAIAALATGLLPVQIAFALAALIFVLTGIISFREVYSEVDWSVIVLLGAMIPVGLALETSGGADLIANQILKLGGGLAVWQILALIMAVTMLLSDIVNNAATAVLMAPIALSIAAGLSLSPDAFLMTVAIGASSAFLTPIGHQSNTLVFGPGGYKFGDYWRLGLPLEVIIVAVSVPLIMHFWL